MSHLRTISKSSISKPTNGRGGPGDTETDHISTDPRPSPLPPPERRRRPSTDVRRSIDSQSSQKSWLQRPVNGTIEKDLHKDSIGSFGLDPASVAAKSNESIVTFPESPTQEKEPGLLRRTLSNLGSTAPAGAIPRKPSRIQRVASSVVEAIASVAPQPRERRPSTASLQQPPSRTRRPSLIERFVPHRQSDASSKNGPGPHANGLFARNRTTSLRSMDTATTSGGVKTRSPSFIQRMAARIQSDTEGIRSVGELITSSSKSKRRDRRKVSDPIADEFEVYQRKAKEDREKRARKHERYGEPSALDIHFPPVDMENNHGANASLQRVLDRTKAFDLFPHGTPTLEPQFKEREPDRPMTFVEDIYKELPAPPKQEKPALPEVKVLMDKLEQYVEKEKPQRLRHGDPDTAPTVQTTSTAKRAGTLGSAASKAAPAVRKTSSPSPGRSSAARSATLPPLTVPGPGEAISKPKKSPPSQAPPANVKNARRVTEMQFPEPDQPIPYSPTSTLLDLPEDEQDELCEAYEADDASSSSPTETLIGSDMSENWRMLITEGPLPVSKNRTLYQNIMAQKAQQIEGLPETRPLKTKLSLEDGDEIVIGLWRPPASTHPSATTSRDKPLPPGPLAGPMAWHAESAAPAAAPSQLRSQSPTKDVSRLAASSCPAPPPPGKPAPANTKPNAVSKSTAGATALAAVLNKSRSERIAKDPPRPTAQAPASSQGPLVPTQTRPVPKPAVSATHTASPQPRSQPSAKVVSQGPASTASRGTTAYVPSGHSRTASNISRTIEPRQQASTSEAHTRPTQSRAQRASPTPPASTSSASASSARTSAHRQQSSTSSIQSERSSQRPASPPSQLSVSSRPTEDSAARARDEKRRRRNGVSLSTDSTEDVSRRSSGTRWSDKRESTVETYILADPSGCKVRLVKPNLVKVDPSRHRSMVASIVGSEGNEPPVNVNPDSYTPVDSINP